MNGFGASGAWWAQAVGGWENIADDSGLAVRDRIAELLYSREKGIGLTIYRYNIGAGSVYESKGYYSEPLRKTEGFYLGNGKYDFSRDKNAVYMMKQAVKNGAEEIVFFVNSPSVLLTKNGMAHQSKNKPFRENISRKNYKEFADCCLDITEHFVKEGLPVKYLSPVNEPIWKWTGGQEGCFYRPDSVRAVFKVFCEELDKRSGLDSLKLSGAEAGDLRYFNNSYTYALLGDKYIRSHLDSVDVHSYCLPLPVFKSVMNNRHLFMKRFRRFMDKHYADIPIKMSEWTHMQGGRDKGMGSAMVTANTIYDDITILHAESWSHWIAVSEVDYCDGLIYINMEDKSFEMTKRFYATGNFSKYIRPGAVRIEASCGNSQIKVLAYLCEGKTVVVAINNSECSENISLDCKQKEVLWAVTDKDSDLTEKIIENTDSIKLPANSVNTFVF